MFKIPLAKTLATGIYIAGVIRSQEFVLKALEVLLLSFLLHWKLYTDTAALRCQCALWLRPLGGSAGSDLFGKRKRLARLPEA